MDCTAVILKACARSRSKWGRHKRSSSCPWRPAGGCACGRDVTAPGVVNDASSLLRRLLFYVCCCRSNEESSELCREWVDHPVGGRGRSEDEGESEGLFLVLLFKQAARFRFTSGSATGAFLQLLYCSVWTQKDGWASFMSLNNLMTSSSLFFSYVCMLQNRREHFTADFSGQVVLLVTSEHSMSHKKHDRTTCRWFNPNWNWYFPGEFVN